MRLKTSTFWCVAVLVAACSPAQKSVKTGETGSRFAEMAAESGLDFVHFNGMSGELYFPEMMGAGVGLLDYDGDGDLDVYLVQGRMLGPGKTLDDAVFPPPPRPLTDRLFRNDTRMTAVGPVVAFTDVTASSGLRAEGYGMGVATADFDLDGDTDIYVTNFGDNQLWRNNGDGTFADVTHAAGVNDARWSVSAAFVDFDHDGLPDLYVGNYVDYSFSSHKPCRSTTSARDYCSPQAYEPQADSLFRNLGAGRFEDVSESTGIARKRGAALGVTAADFDNDGRSEIYVANDGMANFLWRDAGNGQFVDTAELAGAAVNMSGSPEASMGVSAADFDGDGDEDLFMTHLNRETNTLYVNDGQGWFEDRTITSGLGDASFPFTGFGTAWLDVDGDGRLDLFVANGAVTLIEAQVLAGDPYPLRQRNQLFIQAETGFREVRPGADDPLSLQEVSRGTAVGDLDNDGDPDLVVSNNSGPVRLLLNQAGPPDGWTGVELVDPGKPVAGARVALAANGPPVWRRVHTDGSYASASDPRVLLARNPADADLLVQWPDGERERFRDRAPGRYHRLVRGQGQPPQ